MQHLVTRELERTLLVHLRGGIARDLVEIERPFVYRFVFEDLQTRVDLAIDQTSVNPTTNPPDAIVRLKAISLGQLLLLLRHNGADDARLEDIGIRLQGDPELHQIVFALAANAPGHFETALDEIDFASRPNPLPLKTITFTSLDEARESAITALKDSQPLVIEKFPHGWSGTTGASFLARFGNLQTWTGGKFVSLDIYCDPSKKAPTEAHSPVNPAAVVYATNLVVPSEVATELGPPLFSDRCAPPRMFGGRSVLSDPDAWALVTRPHRHPHDLIAWQVFGRKKWTLVPPGFGQHLITRAMGFDTQFCAVLDPDRVQDAAFRAVTTSFVMGPGDVLVLPQGWFHVTYVTKEPALGFSSFARDDVLRFV